MGRPANTIASPVRGLFHLLRGFQILTAPGVRSIVIIPLLVNILLFAAGMYWAIQKFTAWINYIESKLPGWLDWLKFLLWPILLITALMIIAYSFTIVANFVAAPFNGMLAERAERHLTGQFPSRGATHGISGLIKSIPQSLGRELRKFVYYLPRAVGCLLVFLIPVAGGVMGPVVWFLFTAWMMSIEYSDFTFDNHGYPFREMHRQLKGQRGLCLGFGSAVACFTLLPILNLFVMPAAVCGGTSLWVEHFRGKGTQGTQRT